MKPISNGWGPLTYIGAYGVDSPKVDAAIARMVDSPEKTKLIKTVKDMRKHLRKVEKLEGIGKTAADVENAFHGNFGINPYPLTMNELEKDFNTWKETSPEFAESGQKYDKSVRNGAILGLGGFLTGLGAHAVGSHKLGLGISAASIPASIYAIMSANKRRDIRTTAFKNYLADKYEKEHPDIRNIDISVL